jgi:hypothetical protein
LSQPQKSKHGSARRLRNSPDVSLESLQRFRCKEVSGLYEADRNGFLWQEDETVCLSRL